MPTKNIEDMTIEELRSRAAEIRTAATAPDADLDALDKEATAISERIAQYDAEQRRRKIAEKVASGEGTVIRKFGSDTPEPKGPDSAEYRSGWLKQLQGKPLTAEERAAVTASKAIPTETMNMIVHRLELVPIIDAVDVTYIPSNVSFPVEKTVNAANWVEMGTAATDSEDVIDSISLSAYKLIKTIEITADVAAMAVPAFEQWLTSRLANKIQVALANAIFQGDGNNKATGILHAGQVTNTGTWTSTGMTYTDLLNIIAALPTQYATNAKFATTRKVFFGSILGIKTDSGNKVVVADAQSPAKFNILGYPVIVDDNCKADTVIFGDLKEYKLNFAKAIEVAADTSVGFRSGSTVYRAMCLADGKIADKNAFTVYTKGE